MVCLKPELRSLLVAESERARAAVEADSAAVSVWERESDTLRTLVNAGRLSIGEERFPEDEVYPLDSFPAIAALLREGRGFLDPRDVSSAALAAHRRYGSQAGVPIVVEGAVWGELWVARASQEQSLTAVDLDRLRLVAGRLGDALPAYL